LKQEKQEQQAEAKAKKVAEQGDAAAQLSASSDECRRRCWRCAVCEHDARGREEGPVAADGGVVQSGGRRGGVVRVLGAKSASSSRRDERRIGQQVRHRDSAAQRHRLAASRPRADERRRGHARALAPHEVATTCSGCPAPTTPASRRSGRRGEAAGPTRRRRATTSAATRLSSASGSGRRSTARASASSCAASAPRSTGTRGVHHGRQSVARRRRVVCALLRRRPHLSRRSTRELVLRARDRDLGHRGRVHRHRQADQAQSARPRREQALSVWRDCQVRLQGGGLGRPTRRSWWRRRVSRQCSATPPWRCIRTTRATSTCTARCCSTRSWTARFRSCSTQCW
jgi:hypothetical protein